MKEFILKLIRDFLKALDEILEELNLGRKKAPTRHSRQSTSSLAPTERTEAKRISVEGETLPSSNLPLPATGPQEEPQYVRSKSVLTFQERKLLGTIRKAINNEYIILMKVRMGDFIYIANQPKDGTFYPNQVIFKHVDFLLCGKFRVEPLLVIELDDSSHNSAQRMESDKVKNEICDAVGLPYLRIALKKRYDPDLLRRQIKEKILEEAPLFTEEIN